MMQTRYKRRILNSKIKEQESKNQKDKEETLKANYLQDNNDSNIEIHTPFIEHLTVKTLRRFLKYSFRSVALLAVLLFSSIVWYSIVIAGKVTYCYAFNQPFEIGIFEVWFLVEAVFMITMSLKYKYFRNLTANHLPSVTREEFVDLKHEFSQIRDTQAWIEGWFFQKPWSELYLEDFQEWCACLFFNTTPDSLNEQQWQMTNELCETIEANLPRMLKRRTAGSASLEESNPKILLTRDIPKIYHRPLVLYLGVMLLDRGCRILLEYLGFKRIHDKELPFYMRSGTSKEPAIVFFHGLGVGLTSYVLFAAGLAFHYPDRNILLFEMPSITMKLDDNHVLPMEFSSHVAESLVSLGLLKNIVAGHSLGTACVAWMLRWHPQLVQGTVFVDPICFKLWHHHIAYNALYREPKGFHESFINLVAMSEADHALYLHRYFVWFQNTILTKDLPENSFIFLSEKDNIVATEQVVDYLLLNPSSKRKLILYKSFRHGQILASPEFTRVIQSFKELE